MRAAAEELFAHAPVGLFLTDASRRWLQGNPAALRLIGLEPEELVGRRLDDFVHGDDQPLFDRAAVQVLEQGTLERRRALPSQGWHGRVALRAHVATRGRSRRGVVYRPHEQQGSARTHCARCRASSPSAPRPLRARDRELEAILDAFPGVIGLFDTGMRNRFANREYARLFGWQVQDLKGMHIRELIGVDAFADLSIYFEGVLRGEPQTYQRALPDAEAPGGTRLSRSS
jgi:PAS domain S-box-containing protein